MVVSGEWFDAVIIDLFIWFFVMIEVFVIYGVLDKGVLVQLV